MKFLLREVRPHDLQQIKELAEQFSLLNLPPDERVIDEKIRKSLKAFKGETFAPEDAEYLFVVEDVETHRVAGTSQILAKHGTEESPHTYFDVRSREKFSKELGIGFIHQVLKLCYDSDGPTEIGGLIVGKTYRGRPEKLGKQISLVRFLYMAMYPERFESRVLCELTPPLTPDGRSEFWEALGRKFTGLPYEEADHLSNSNKEFIKSLFPEEDIYTCVLDAKARYMIGRVGLSTMPAKHLLESIGFNYLQQIDPFDGGPHYGAKTTDITIVKKARKYEVSKEESTNFTTLGVVGSDAHDGFKACLSYFEAKGKKVHLPKTTRDLLGLKGDETVFASPVPEGAL